MGKKRNIGTVLVAVLVAAIIGLVGYSVWKSRQHPPAATPQVKTPIAVNHAANRNEEPVYQGRKFWRWENPGAEPFVPFQGPDGKDIPREERRKTAEAHDATVLEAHGLPADAEKALLKKIAAHPDGDTIFYAKDGTRYYGITYRDKRTGKLSITKNVVVRFNSRGRKVADDDDKRKAAEWSVTDSKGTTWTYDRFAWWCENSGVKMTLPKAPPPKRTAYISPAQPDCYRVYHDYTGQADVDAEGGQAHFEVGLDITPEQAGRLMNNSCFFHHDDATGEDSKPSRDCDCAEGGYPPRELAEANGLPAEQPVTFYAKGSRKGYWSYPVGFMHSGLYCVRVDAYGVRTEGFEAFHAFSRFDIVSGRSMRETQKVGKLDWVLGGATRF
jgi:hypothetical protein